MPNVAVTYLAINLIKRRLCDAFGEDIQFAEKGQPVDFASAIQLAENDKFQFQHWALSLVQARPLKEGEGKGAGRGVDGLRYFYDCRAGAPPAPARKKKATGAVALQGEPVHRKKSSSKSNAATPARRTSGQARCQSVILESGKGAVWGCPDLMDRVGRVKSLRNPHEGTAKLPYPPLRSGQPVRQCLSPPAPRATRSPRFHEWPPGNCYDNAFTESFWSTLKYELVYHRRFATRAEARSAIFDYIENPITATRLHSSLDYQSPLNFQSELN